MKTFSPNLGPTNGMWQKIALGARPRTSSSESESPTVHPESLVKSERKEEPAHKNTSVVLGPGGRGEGGLSGRLRSAAQQTPGLTGAQRQRQRQEGVCLAAAASGAARAPGDPVLLITSCAPRHAVRLNSR